MKDFVLINSGQYFKSMTEKLHSKLSEKKIVAESFYSFLTMPDEVEKYVELIEKMPEANTKFC